MQRMRKLGREGNEKGISAVRSIMPALACPVLTHIIQADNTTEFIYSCGTRKHVKFRNSMHVPGDGKLSEEQNNHGFSSVQVSSDDVRIFSSMVNCMGYTGQVSELGLEAGEDDR
ncbi:predicted protein [Sclerotinia sclerotiorum 1980 UF-70]|uniref:Uncharacterized protein n=1 Tax=Sclerotinia sclerotiorum (strain ATCC 18683 / 1980 / Ss-1) TaxID=665079 RepID=A7F280_SCLS1|nr:predicted protein [Sclerotinia sclerotiorum 1980 UF-70]EDN95822.1 predicted protein [Sclerotinia sclerotiorum 1980 UF-70]